MSHKILVTGGAGFIGSHFVDRLFRKDLSYLPLGFSVQHLIAFVLKITRSISTEDSGMWGNISDVSSHFTLL